MKNAWTFYQGYSRKKYGRQYIFLRVVGAESFQIIWVKKKKTFCGFPGVETSTAGRVYDLCVYYMTGAPEGSPKVVLCGFMEKPGIEPATPGLQGIALIHYTTGASRPISNYTFCGRVPWLYQYWPGGSMLFVVLCPGTPEGSTGSGSGFKASQKTGQRLKVSSDRLGESGNRTCDPWFTRHSAYPLHHGGLERTLRGKLVRLITLIPFEIFC